LPHDLRFVTSSLFVASSLIELYVAYFIYRITFFKQADGQGKKDKNRSRGKKKVKNRSIKICSSMLNDLSS